MNQILGEKVSITTDKPQTTRNSIRGIYTDTDAQMIFLDTPGIHKGRTKLGKYMTDKAIDSISEVDMVLFLVDDDIDKGPGDRAIAKQLENVRCPKILIINKMDTMAPDKYRKIYEDYDSMDLFDEVFGISAKDGTNVPLLVETLKNYLEEGPAYYPGDMITDHTERFLVSEIIREKLLMYLRDEIPHGVAVEIEEYIEEEELTRIGAVIYCEKKSHKSIIIGKDGRKLKGVGKSARQEIEKLTGTKVFLRLWVKIKENWRDSDFMLSNLGYKDK